MKRLWIIGSVAALGAASSLTVTGKTNSDINSLSPDTNGSPAIVVQALGSGDDTSSIVSVARFQHPGNQMQGSVSQIDSTVFLQYEGPLTELANQLSERGHNISDLLVDDRFEVYERITSNFTESAERRSPTIDDYKQRLGYDDKRDKIVGFISENREHLIEAENDYGIPRFVIAAIIGIESDYGRVVGRYNPFNAYVSMIAQEYRQDFAFAQLEELLIFTQRHDIDILDMKSSYAGAMAYAQFIPYSLNRWFVGADIYDMKNNIASVANYLAHFLDITGSLERAVYRYNPSDLYTNAVMDLASEAEELAGES